MSVSLTRTTPEGPLVAASVWHRPVVEEAVKDRLAERQARAAVALVRLGKAEAVWPLLRVRGADPRLPCSFIVNWLNPLGADPHAIAAELARRGSPDPAETAELVRRGSPDPAETADRRSPASEASADSGTPSVPLVARSGDLATTRDRLDSPATPGTRRVASPATPKMDAILFHPETSMRRALILSLGTYGIRRDSPPASGSH